MEITLSLPMLLFLMLMTGYAGFVDSAAGGGGLISLPAHVFAGLPVHYTYGTNKFSAACGTTFATAQFFQKGAMNIRVGLLAAVGSFVGSALGSHIVLLLSDQVLRTMMLIILPVAAVLILWRRDLPDENRDDGTLNAKKAVLALAIGLGIGLYDGIFGPGTGTFAIIAFTTLMGFDLRTAGGNMRFSSTFKLEKMPRSSGQKPMPKCAMRCAGTPMVSVPFTIMLPLRLPTMFMIDFNVVERPEPLRPNNVTSSPLFTCKSMPCRMCDSP